MSSRLAGDARFASVASDPRFKKAGKRRAKVKLDKRFAAALTDDRFALVSRAPVDKYGRPVVAPADRRAELAPFYEIEEEGKDDAGAETEATAPATKGKKKKQEKKKKKSGSDEPAAAEARLARLNALARGEDVDDEGSEDSEEDEEAPDEDEEVVAWDAGLPPTHETTTDTLGPFARLAITDCDWSRIKARDLLVILSSLCPPQGSCAKVSVYLSEYGARAQAAESRFGPDGALRQHKANDLLGDEGDKASSTMEDADDEDAPGDVLIEGGFDAEALRRYELRKLRHYFAVAEFDSAATANAVYEAGDGVDVESTSAPLRLAFVEPDQVFDASRLRDDATEAPKWYKPAKRAALRAAQQTKVTCTWDEDEPDRKDAMKMAFSAAAADKDNSDDDQHPDALNIRAYLAEDSDDSDSDSDDAEEDAAASLVEGGHNNKTSRRDRLRAALGLNTMNDDDDDDEEDDAGDGEAAASSEAGAFAAGLDADDDDEDEDRYAGDDEMTTRGATETPFEARQRKVRERRKARRAKRTADAREAIEGNDDADAPPRDRKGAAVLAALDDRRDFDARRLEKLDKLQAKPKLRGKRKRLRDALAAEATQDGFAFDVGDDRFAAVLDASRDDFGLDPNAPTFKRTGGMRALLAERAKRRAATAAASSST